MQTLPLTALTPATLTLLGRLAEEAAASQRDVLDPGAHAVDEIVTLHLNGTVKVSADTARAPTCSIPLLPALALMTKRMGLQRGKALEILCEVMQEALSLGKDAATELLAETGVAEAQEAIKTEVIAKLPKTPMKGKVMVEGSVLAVGISLPSAE